MIQRTGQVEDKCNIISDICNERDSMVAVSYTHLDVYKRQK